MNMASILAGIMAAALVLYVLLAGADYGAGLWDLLSGGSDKEEQKELIASAIQPIWEANHVWLIFIVVLLFSGFPPAFAAIMTALGLPILLMLSGIVLRGSSFVFRAYATLNSELQQVCGYVFSISSCLTPFFGGIVLGAISDDHILMSRDASVNGYVFNWMTPFSLSCGLLVLALSAFLAAAYLTVEAPTVELRRTFRIRAGIAGVVSTIITFTTLFLAMHGTHGLAENLLHGSAPRFFEIGAILSLLAVYVALFRDQPSWIRAATAAHAGCISIAWVAAQYPYLVRPQRTIFNSVVAENVIQDIIVASGIGAVVLFPSLALLFYIFKDKKREKISASMAAQ